MAEKAFGERIDAMVVAGRAGVERVREEHGIVDRGDADVAHRQYMHDELDVVADLENARRLQHRLQKRDRFRLSHLVGREPGAVEETVGAGPTPAWDVTTF